MASAGNSRNIWELIGTEDCKYSTVKSPETGFYFGNNMAGGWNKVSSPVRKFETCQENNRSEQSNVDTRNPRKRQFSEIVSVSDDDSMDDESDMPMLCRYDVSLSPEKNSKVDSTTKPATQPSNVTPRVRSVSAKHTGTNSTVRPDVVKSENTATAQPMPRLLPVLSPEISASHMINKISADSLQNFEDRRTELYEKKVSTVRPYMPENSDFSLSECGNSAAASTNGRASMRTLTRTVVVTSNSIGGVECTRSVSSTSLMSGGLISSRQNSPSLANGNKEKRVAQVLPQRILPVSTSATSLVGENKFNIAGAAMRISNSQNIFNNLRGSCQNTDSNSPRRRSFVDALVNPNPPRFGGETRRRSQCGNDRQINPERSNNEDHSDVHEISSDEISSDETESGDESSENGSGESYDLATLANRLLCLQNSIRQKSGATDTTKGRNNADDSTQNDLENVDISGVAGGKDGGLARTRAISNSTILGENRASDKETRNVVESMSSASREIRFDRMLANIPDNLEEDGISSGILSEFKDENEDKKPPEETILSVGRKCLRPRNFLPYSRFNDFWYYSDQSRGYTRPPRRFISADEEEVNNDPAFNIISAFAKKIYSTHIEQKRVRLSGAFNFKRKSSADFISGTSFYSYLCGTSAGKLLYKGRRSTCVPSCREENAGHATSDYTPLPHTDHNYISSLNYRIWQYASGIISTEKDSNDIYDSWNFRNRRVRRPYRKTRKRYDKLGAYSSFFIRRRTLNVPTDANMDDGSSGFSSSSHTNSYTEPASSSETGRQKRTYTKCTRRDSNSNNSNTTVTKVRSKSAHEVNSTTHHTSAGSIEASSDDFSTARTRAYSATKRDRTYSNASSNASWCSGLNDNSVCSISSNISQSSENITKNNENITRNDESRIRSIENKMRSNFSVQNRKESSVRNVTDSGRVIGVITFSDDEPEKQNNNHSFEIKQTRANVAETSPRSAIRSLRLVISRKSLSSELNKSAEPDLSKSQNLTKSPEPPVLKSPEPVSKKPSVPAKSPEPPILKSPGPLPKKSPKKEIENHGTEVSKRSLESALSGANKKSKTESMAMKTSPLRSDTSIDKTKDTNSDKSIKVSFTSMSKSTGGTKMVLKKRSAPSEINVAKVKKKTLTRAEIKIKNEEEEEEAKKELKVQRMLKQLQSSDGFVTEEKRTNKGGHGTLLVDSDLLSREERSLQMALMRITQMESEASFKSGQTSPTKSLSPNKRSAPTKSSVKKPGPAASNSCQKANSLKKKALACSNKSKLKTDSKTASSVLRSSSKTNINSEVKTVTSNSNNNNGVIKKTVKELASPSAVKTNKSNVETVPDVFKIPAVPNTKTDKKTPVKTNFKSPSGIKSSKRDVESGSKIFKIPATPNNKTDKKTPMKITSKNSTNDSKSSADGNSVGNKSSNGGIMKKAKQDLLKLKLLKNTKNLKKSSGKMLTKFNHTLNSASNIRSLGKTCVRLEKLHENSSDRKLVGKSKKIVAGGIAGAKRAADVSVRGSSAQMSPKVRATASNESQAKVIRWDIEDRQTSLPLNRLKPVSVDCNIPPRETSGPVGSNSGPSSGPMGFNSGPSSGSSSGPIRYILPAEVKKIQLICCHTSGETVLHRAAKQGNQDVVVWCCESGYVDVNAVDNAGFTPLHEACLSSYHTIARYLIHYGADVNTTSSVDATRPIHSAVGSDDLEMVRLLLSHGAVIEPLIDNGKTVHTISRSDSMTTFLKEYLLDGEMDKESISVWDFSPVFGEDVADHHLFSDVPEDDDDVGISFETSEESLQQTTALPTLTSDLDISEEGSSSKSTDNQNNNSSASENLEIRQS